ncbi:amidohydrolase family protein [Actinomadura madurae]
MQISTSGGPGMELDDPRLAEFWAAADDLGAALLIHPWGCTLGERLNAYYLFNTVGNPTETALALSRIVFSGLLEHHPGLRIWSAHGGGYLASYFGRADHAWAARQDARTTQRRAQAHRSRPARPPRRVVQPLPAVRRERPAERLAAQGQPGAHHDVHRPGHRRAPRPPARPDRGRRRGVHAAAVQNQWDGLGHVFDHGITWNVRRGADVVTSEGDFATGIERIAAPVIGRRGPARRRPRTR